MTAPNDSVTLAAKVAISGQVLAQAVGDEVVLLDLASERYFGLDAVGTRIWELLVARTDLVGVLTKLREEFDAPAGRMEADLLALVSALLAAGLITVD